MIPHDNISDADIDGWLNTLGLTTLCQWDVLVFLYRHPTSLVGADVIAHLVGYASDLVVAALDVLEFLGLVVRSRVSQAARLYQFTVPTDPQRGDAWARLLALTSQRVGRVRLAMRLRESDPTAQAWRHTTQHLLTEARQGLEESRQGLRATRHMLIEARQSIEASRRQLHPHQGGEEPWRKAI
jgi:DNA-binding MarR family transcriptional regulator